MTTTTKTRAEAVEAAARALVDGGVWADSACAAVSAPEALFQALQDALDLPAEAPKRGDEVLTAEQRTFYAAERAVKDWLERHFEKECDWLEHSRLESDAWAAYHAMVASESSPRKEPRS